MSAHRYNLELEKDTDAPGTGGGRVMGQRRSTSKLFVWNNGVCGTASEWGKRQMCHEKRPTGHFAAVNLIEIDM
jgi:hypothetical protein